MIDKNDQLDQVSEKIEKIKSRKKKNDNTQKQIGGSRYQLQCEYLSNSSLQ